jgi:zinc/manganese transport system substrate-binding protein
MNDRLNSMNWPAGLALAACLAGTLSAAAAPLRVVATLPDFADFARRVGGAEVDVSSIATGDVDPHFFVPRPRHASLLNRADLLVVGGMAIDVWAANLIDSARNPKIRFGADGYLDPAIGVRALEVSPGKIDGASGDVHPFGNPHYWFTEKNVATVIENIAARLAKLRPEKAAYFKTNAAAYRAEIAAAYAEARKKLAPWKGSAFVQYHRSWNYFAQELGLVIAGDIEPKPGIPPSARHLSDLIAAMKADGTKLIIAEPYYPQAPLSTVADATGATVLRLPLYLGSRKETPDHLSNLRANVDALAAALGKE